MKNGLINKLHDIVRGEAKAHKSSNITLNDEQCNEILNLVKSKLSQADSTTLGAEIEQIMRHAKPRVVASEKDDATFDRALKSFTVSYLLGWVILDAVESKSGVLNAPARLYKLHKENQYRKIRQKVKKELEASFKRNSEPLTVNNNAPAKAQKKQIEEVQKRIMDIAGAYPLLSSKQLQSVTRQNYSPTTMLALASPLTRDGLNTFFRVFELNLSSSKPTQQIENSSAAIFLISLEYVIAKDISQTRIEEFISTAKNKNIPVALLDTGSSSNLPKLDAIIAAVDYIFSLDVSRYEHLAADKVYEIPVGINQSIYNPINRSCYPAKKLLFVSSASPVRANTIRSAFLNRFEGDSVYFSGTSSDDNHAYEVKLSELSSVFKLYQVYLNCDDQDAQHGMLATQAKMSNTPVINYYPQDKNNPDQAAAELVIGDIKQLLSKKWHQRKIAHVGYREAMQQQSYYTVGKIIENALAAEGSSTDKKVSIISATMREEYLERLVDSIQCQNYPLIECIIVAQNYSPASLRKLKRLLKNCTNLVSYKVMQNNSADSLGARLNQAAKFATGDYLAKFDDDDLYFENYLSDMLIPFSFGNFGIVGKLETFVYVEAAEKTYQYFIDHGHRVSKALIGGTLVIDAVAFNKVDGFSDLTVGEDKNILEKMTAHNIAMYATDPFNYIIWRGKDLNQHTWQADADVFVKNGCVVESGLALDIANI